MAKLLDMPPPFAVLDKGYIQLVDYMGGDEAVVRAARICYDSESSPEADVRLIQRCLKAKHNTPFEHAVFTFEVKCPILVARQLMRTRIASYCERSLRYCVAEREYYTPPDEPMLDAYRRHMDSSFDLYLMLVEGGWPKERARAILGTAVYSKFVWTLNSWSLMNWLAKRLDKSAQWEHRQYALAALSLFKIVMPVTAHAFKEMNAAKLG